jgi:phosphate transport system substrate-binding protein
MLSKKISLFFFLGACFSLNAFADTDEMEWVGCGISKKAYMIEMAKAYEIRENLKINVNGGGATKGIRDVASKKAQMGGSCRFHLPDNSIEQGVSFEPVAWDALVVIVNKQNPVNNISFDQVRDLYLGKINNWKQLGGPDKPVNLFIRKGKISGVGYTIRKLLYANRHQEFTANKTFKSSGPLEKAVLDDPNSIAISGISSARLRDVKLLTLNGKYPDYDTIKSGQYVLYRPLFLTYDKNSSRISEIKKFIKFIHSRDGREIMKKNGVVPYLEALRLVMKQIKQNQMATEYTNDKLVKK